MAHWQQEGTNTIATKAGAVKSRPGTSTHSLQENPTPTRAISQKRTDKLPTAKRSNIKESILICSQGLNWWSIGINFIQISGRSPDSRSDRLSHRTRRKSSLWACRSSWQMKSVDSKTLRSTRDSGWNRRSMSLTTLKLGSGGRRLEYLRLMMVWKSWRCGKICKSNSQNWWSKSSWSPISSELALTKVMRSAVRSWRFRGSRRWPPKPQEAIKLPVVKKWKSLSPVS